MKSMTIHGIDKQMADMIKARAESEKLSINQTIKKMLETSLGIKPPSNRKNIEMFKDFCGVWTQEDLNEFNERVSDSRKVDPPPRLPKYSGWSKAR